MTFCDFFAVFFVSHITYINCSLFTFIHDLHGGVDLSVYSSVAGFEHLDPDADRVRSFLRDRVCDEGSSDRASINAADRARLDLRRDAVVAAAPLPSPAHASVARPQRDLVRRHLATG